MKEKFNDFSKDWYMQTRKAQYILGKVNEKKLRHRYFMENTFRLLRIKKGNLQGFKQKTLFLPPK